MQAMVETLIMRADSKSATRRGRWICLAGVALAVSLGAFLSAYVASRPYLGSLTAFMLFLTLLGIGLFVAEGFHSVEGLYRQRDRDMDANRIWKSLDRGEDPDEPFVLYLRPFLSTDAMKETTTHLVPIHGASRQFVVGTDKLEFEAQIEQAARPIGLLVGLGHPLEHEGAGRIQVSEARWQEAIGKMMDKAELIILLPSPAGGTRWEIGRLVTSQLLQKTIIIDPPNNASSHSAYDPAAEWAATQDIFQSYGYELPEDAADGQMVYFAEGSRTPTEIAPLSLSFDSLHVMRRFMRTVSKRAAALQGGN